MTFERGCIRVPPLPKAWISAADEFDPARAAGTAIGETARVANTRALPKPKSKAAPIDVDMRAMLGAVARKLEESAALIRAVLAGRRPK
jgi:hypothetical protein